MHYPHKMPALPCALVLIVFAAQLHCIHCNNVKRVVINTAGFAVTEKIGDNFCHPVNKLRFCGGKSQILQWCYNTCRLEDHLCHVPSGSSFVGISQVDFIPSVDITKIGVRFVVKSVDGLVDTSEDQGAVYQPSGDNLKQGVEYTVTVPGGVTEELKGKEAVFRYILYNRKNEQVEACVEANVQFD